MKKKVFSLMMMLLLAVTGIVRADELTVNDGTTTNSYVPVYGFYTDAYLKCEYVVPGEALVDMIGADISQMTYYAATPAADSWGVANFQVFMKEVDFTTISAFQGMDGATMVYEGSLDGTQSTMEIAFSAPYHYNGGNLLIGIYNTEKGTYKSISWSGENVDGASYQGYSYTSLEAVSGYQRNFLPKTTFTFNGGGGGAGDQLHVKYVAGEEEVIDALNMGVRPAGAWMEPFNFTMYTEGRTYTVNVLDFTPSDGLFTVEGEELPFQVVRNNDVDLTLVCNGTEAGVIERQFVAITEGDRAAHIWPVTVELYAPEVPDVWEMACTEATTFPFVEVPATAHNTVLHNDYTLPFPEIPEGYDAVYKLVFTADQMLDAEVTYGENGKVALYREGFEGEGGPMADNYYTGLGMNEGGAAATPFEAQIGEGTSTFGYFPFYTLYNYSIAENLFLAPELEEAGVTTAPMTSLSWYATNEYGYNQQGITIWMANVDDETLTTTSHVVTNMTKVYTGAMTPAIGWNEFVFNEGTFAWDGHSNILIYCQRNNGEWNSTVYWEATASLPFNASSYKYQDSAAYDATVAQSMTTSTTRPNIIMKADGRNRDEVLFSDTFEGGSLDNWTLVDADADGDGWQIATPAAYGIGDAHSGTYCASSWSWNNYAIYPDNYMISPLVEGASSVTYYVSTNTYYPDHYAVMASTTGTNTSDFVIVYEEDAYRGVTGRGVKSSTTQPGDRDMSAWAEKTVTLPAGTKYVAFRHYNSDDMNYLFIDDVTVYGNGGVTPPTPPTPPTPGFEYTAGPVIENLPVIAGTYYLVASSTTPDFEVTINAEAMPCPPVEGFAFNPIPADNADEIEPASVTLSWSIPAYATGWRLIFGTTYHPEANHPQTIMYPEDGSFTNQMVNSYTVRNLWNNTNYFWRVEFNNGGCAEGVSSPVWGFTTHLNVPQGLAAVDETVFDDETVVLNWNAVVDRTYRMYNVYRNGELIGHTDVNQISNSTYTDGPLAYNMEGYTYYVTAVYDEGESAPSNTVNVKVSGRGNVNGHVFEQDGTTGIAGATVTMTGLDEFGVSHTYNFQTNAQGAYSGAVYAGTYNGQAAKEGYQTIAEPVQGNPIAMVYNETTSPVDYILDENFDPVCTVIAQYYPDSLDPTAPYVKVYWGCGLPGEEIIEPFETGDFSLFDWQIDPTYPWVIDSQHAYEGNYCMKSGNQQVVSSTSTMQVTVNIPADGEMAFFSRISSEQGWDYGYFYIDNQQMASYTGEGSWGERKFPVTAGDHTFKWEYTEDFIISSGDDCFYVDYITFYRRPEPLGAGWHTYLEGEFNDALRSNLTDNPSFGYHYPTSITGQYNGFQLTKVSMFSDNLYGAVGGTYTVNIYQGGSVPGEGTLVSTQTVELPVGLGEWVDWDLDTPVSVSGSQDLWVIYYVNQAGGMGYPAGMCNTDSNPNGDWWDGGSGWENYGGGVWTMRNYFTDRSGRSVVLGTAANSGNAPIAQSAGAPIVSKLRQYVKGDNTVTATSLNPGAPSKPLVMPESNRALSHYRVYRTSCYNDGPYTEENTVLLATVWMPDTVYIDVEWADLEPGVYKWGVGSVYAGNRGELYESPIAWAQPIAVNDNNRVFEGKDVPENNFKTVFSTGDVSDYMPTRGNATVILTAGDVWGDGSGYQMLLDADATAYGTVIPETGALSTSCSGNEAIYAEFEYKIPTNADGNCSTSNIVINNSVSIEIPAGTYDWCITNPTPGDRIWIAASTGNVGGRENDYVFEEGMVYEFVMSMHGTNDGVDVTITSNPNPPTPPTPPTPGTGLQLPRESEIVWSNCLEKGMWLGENDVDITVLLNSADSPEGTTVSFVNLNEAEQELYPVAPITLDGTGYYAWDLFRKGDYQVTVTMEGYEPVVENVSIWEPTSLRYVLIEIIYGVDNLYVSRTGWAMWDGQGAITPGPGPQPGEGDSFSVDFEAGMPAGWNVIDANNDGWTWCMTSDIPTTWTYYSSLSLDWYHGGTNAICSGSYINGVGALNPDEYLVSPQVNIAAGSTFSFYAAATDENYAADHFGVFVSDNGTSDWTMVNEWTLTAKGGAKSGDLRATRDGNGNRLGNWYTFSVDLSAFAGQKYIAIRHFNCSDQYIMCVDDIELTSGAKDGDRHLEYYKVLCESIDHEPIFNANTVNPFCQLATDELVEGELYICKVAAVYSTGMSDYVECVWQYESCEHYAGTLNGVTVDGNTISWDYPGGGPVPPVPGEGDSFSVDFEAGLPAGWNVIDANNDGWTWCLTSAIPTTWTYYASLSLDWYHSGTNAICSGSYINGVGALNPDEYLVSPQVNIANGSTFSFYAAATDASYAADHFGVFVSDNGTSDWTMVNEWTLTAKGGAKAGDLRATRDGNGNRLGNWYTFSVDLSAFAGQKYIAIRHFNCSDQYIMCVDDITLTSGAKSNRDYLQYCTETFSGGVGTGGGAVYWGIRFPAADLTAYAGQSLTKVGVFTDVDGDYGWTYSGTYTVSVYQGGATAPGTLMSTASEYLPGDMAWHDITLSTPVTIDATQDLWLTFYTPDIAYPMSGCDYVGNNNSDFLSLDGTTWEHSTDYGLNYTWMIRGLVEGGAPVPPPTDGNVLGAMVFVDGEWEAFVPVPTNTYTYEGEGNEICVRMVYNGTNELPSNNFFYAMSCEECEEINPVGPGTCEPGAPIHAEQLSDQQIKVWWGEQPAAPISEWLYYDNGTYATSVGAGGTLYWGTMFPAASLAPYAGTNLTKVAIFTSYACSATLNVYVGGAQPGGSPAATQTFTMAGDQQFMEITLNNAVPVDGTQNLWITFYQTGETYPADACADTGDPNNRWVSIDGAEWLDLATAGLPGYGWMIRGFVTNEGKGGELVTLPEFKGNVGGELSHTEVVSKPADLSFMNRASLVKYNVYRSTEPTTGYTLIGEVAETGATYYEYIDTPVEAGTYYYQVRAYYDNDCESEPAVAADDPTHNYVSGSTVGDGLAENDANVALYPNPTNGNVTIEAAGMSRITVVSVLGQVVYDTEVNADNCTLNMAQFNAGMYMVRVYTENGVTVKRVTVMQ